MLYTTTFEEITILGLFPAFYIFNGLLILLQVLHYFWFYLICQVAISAFKAGKVRPSFVDASAINQRSLCVPRWRKTNGVTVKIARTNKREVMVMSKNTSDGLLSNDQTHIVVYICSPSMNDDHFNSLFFRSILSLFSFFDGVNKQHPWIACVFGARPSYRAADFSFVVTVDEFEEDVPMCLLVASVTSALTHTHAYVSKHTNL